MSIKYDKTGKFVRYNQANEKKWIKGKGMGELIDKNSKEMILSDITDKISRIRAGNNQNTSQKIAFAILPSFNIHLWASWDCRNMEIIVHTYFHLTLFLCMWFVL